MKNVLLIMAILLLSSCDYKNNKQEAYNIVLPGHAVPDTTTALRIAEAIWRSNFGEYVLKEKPYLLVLEKGEDTIWHVSGTLKRSDDPNIITMGGVAYIAFRSKDCKILELYHSE